MKITFQVYQTSTFIKSDGVGRATEKIGEFPATMHGLRKAFARAKDETYGQEPGRIAPKARCFVVAANDGAPVKFKTRDRNTGESYSVEFTIEPAEIDNRFCDYRTTKTALFNELLRTIATHL